MTPDAAIDGLVQILAVRSAISEDEIYEALGDAGIPYDAADRTCCLDRKLIQYGGGKSSIAFCDVYDPRMRRVAEISVQSPRT